MQQISRAQAIASALIVVALAVLALAFWARVRATRTPSGPAIGAWRLGLSQAVSAYSFWILLGVSAAAYFRGLSAIWIAAGMLAGAMLNGLYVGPRLIAARADSGARNTLESLQPRRSDASYPGATSGAAAIVFLMLLIGIVAQLRVAGSVLATGLGAPLWMAVTSIGALGFLPALIGGRRAAVDASVLSALIVPPIAVFLVIPAALFAGSSGGIVRGLEWIDPAVSTWLGGPGVASSAAALGGFALGFTLVGQPAVLDQFGAARSARAARLATVVAGGWFALVLGSMLLLGWSALVLYSSVDDANLVLIDATARLLSPTLQSLPVIAVVLAVAATIGHQLVTLAEIGATSWPGGPESEASARRTQWLAWIAAALTIAVAATTSFGSMRLYVLTLVCLGVALGPVLLVRLAGSELRPAVSAIAIRVGLISALLLLLVRSDLANSLAVAVSFLLALAVAWLGRVRRLLK